MTTGALIGQTIGSYRVVQELARGGMATIYLARQESLNREVAIKVLTPALQGDRTFLDRFRLEIETTARLQHPHIIPIHDVGEFDGLPYIVMAYVPGGTLYERLLINPLAPEEVGPIIRDIAGALDYAHDNGIIHRDVKPQNVLLDRQGNAILTDFGVAKVIADTAEITRDKVVGTPMYLAPELIIGGSEITSAVDVYGLGVTLYYALVGSHPFAGRDTAQMMWAHLNELPPLIEPERDDLPPGIDYILQRALAKDPSARYDRASKLSDDLHKLWRGEAPQYALEDHIQEISVPTSGDTATNLEQAVNHVIDQIVRIERPDGGSGSGVYIDGQVITCQHVIDGAQGIYVHFRDGEAMEAEVIACANEYDLALLWLSEKPQNIPEDRLNGMNRGAHKPDLGELIASIGHPLNLEWAVAGGHYNGLRHPGEIALKRFGITLTCPLVQVDVAINPGNSGGPLIDSEAHLIGIATSIINPALVNNIGFAIDADTVWAFIEEHRADEGRWMPYNDGHHHPQGREFDPDTGRPIQPVDLVPLAEYSGSSIRCSSCGHVYGAHLAYCPTCGKPNAQPQNGQTAETASPRAAEPVENRTCTSCGFEYSQSAPFCPACGKPTPEE